MSTDKNTQLHDIWNVEAALARLGGNETLLNRIVGMYLDQIHLKQQQLSNAVQAMNVEEVQLQSHSLKGLSGDVGADAVREKASEIELLAKSNQMDKVNKEIVELNAVIEATVTHMEKSVKK